MCKRCVVDEMMVGVFEGCWKLKDELEVVLEGVLEIV